MIPFISPLGFTMTPALSENKKILWTLLRESCIFKNHNQWYSYLYQNLPADR